MRTLQVRRWVKTGTDSHNNDTFDFGEPEDWRVHELAPGPSQEPAQAGRDLSMIEWTVYSPTRGLPTERDVVLVDGTEYRVEGRPSVWPTGDAVTQLSRAEG